LTRLRFNHLVYMLDPELTMSLQWVSDPFRLSL
jgi:hypothetical protein